MVELIEAIHTDLWQVGERRRKRYGLDASARRPEADARPQLDVLGAAGS
jgi:hypothetical protein